MLKVRLTVCRQRCLPVVTSWVAVGERCGEEEEADLEKHYDGMIEYIFFGASIYSFIHICIF